jgi:hypothetical protein
MGRRQRGPERCQSPARVSHGCRLAWSGSPDSCPPGADLTTRQESGRPAPRVRWVRTAARGIVRQFALQTLAHRVTAQVGAEVAPVRHGARAGRPGACGTTTLQADFGRVSTLGRRPAPAAEFGLASGATVPAAWRVHAGRVRRVLLNEASNHPLISQQIPSISLGTAGRDEGGTGEQPCRRGLLSCGFPVESQPSPTASRPADAMACKRSGVQSPQLHQPQRIPRSPAHGPLSAVCQQITISGGAGGTRSTCGRRGPVGPGGGRPCCPRRGSRPLVGRRLPR